MYIRAPRRGGDCGTVDHAHGQAVVSQWLQLSIGRADGPTQAVQSLFFPVKQTRETFSEVGSEFAKSFQIEPEQRQTGHEKEYTLQEREEQACNAEYYQQNTGCDAYNPQN